MMILVFEMNGSNLINTASQGQKENGHAGIQIKSA
jgi:hypothetical protein